MLQLLFIALAAAPSALACTNGTLIPSYICDLKAHAMGAPQSLAQVLPFFVEDDARAKVAGYHNVNAAPYVSQDLCTAIIQNNAPFAASNKFIVKTKGGENLIGLIVWVQDYMNGAPHRIGNIVDSGLNMVKYPYGCGETIVHQKALDDEAFCKSESAPFSWNVPECGIEGAFVEVRGVCVTEKGFGKFAVQIPTGGQFGVGTMMGANCNKPSVATACGVAPTPAVYNAPPAPVKPVSSKSTPTPAPATSKTMIPVSSIYVPKMTTSPMYAAPPAAKVATNVLANSAAGVTVSIGVATFALLL